MTLQFSTRWATSDDLAGIENLMALAINQLQSDYLSPEQVVASREVMGLDRQLVADGTYLLAEYEGKLAGCGGWSRRATLYGGDHSTALRDPALLDPAVDPARIRAMYTHPDFTRQGIGRLILSQCEAAAAEAGFASAELMATASGQPLYKACGYEVVHAADADVAGVTVPLTLMRKALR